MSTNKPKLQAYVEPRIFLELDTYANRRNLSQSQALNEILSLFFGLKEGYTGTRAPDPKELREKELMLDRLLDKVNQQTEALTVYQENKQQLEFIANTITRLTEMMSNLDLDKLEFEGGNIQRNSNLPQITGDSSQIESESLSESPLPDIGLGKLIKTVISDSPQITNDLTGLLTIKELCAELGINKRKVERALQAAQDLGGGLKVIELNGIRFESSIALVNNRPSRVLKKV